MKPPIPPRPHRSIVAYVKTDDGRWLVQVPADNAWGFSLVSDDQSWPGGHGIAQSWKWRDESDVPDEVRDELGWILTEARSE